MSWLSLPYWRPRNSIQTWEGLTGTPAECKLAQAPGTCRPREVTLRHLLSGRTWISPLPLQCQIPESQRPPVQPQQARVPDTVVSSRNLTLTVSGLTPTLSNSGSSLGHQHCFLPTLLKQPSLWLLMPGSDISILGQGLWKITLKKYKRDNMINVFVKSICFSVKTSLKWLEG